MTEDDQRGLDEELRRLFADDRLTLPVATGAEQAVIAGAHRRRRRRLAVAAASGALTMAALAFVGVALAGVVRGPGRTEAASTSPSVTLTTTSSAPQSAVPAGDLTLGPYGIDKLWLGMSIKELYTAAKSSVLPLTPTAVGALCQRVTGFLTTTAGYAGSGVPGSAVPTYSTGRTVLTAPAGPITSAQKISPVRIVILVSSSSGVDEITTATGDVHTPEGIRIGSPLSQVTQLYPSITRSPPNPLSQVEVPVRGNPAARYVFHLDATSTVVSMSLLSVKGVAAGC